jgi:hypothetical protein
LGREGSTGKKAFGKKTLEEGIGKKALGRDIDKKALGRMPWGGIGKRHWEESLEEGLGEGLGEGIGKKALERMHWKECIGKKYWEEGIGKKALVAATKVREIFLKTCETFRTTFPSHLKIDD